MIGEKGPARAKVTEGKKERERKPGQLFFAKKMTEGEIVGRENRWLTTNFEKVDSLPRIAAGLS